ncbi:hypothetical protein Ciccas_003928 [Cichlidogyrus casuarinus]|uniref:Uncharacterized protein n=1 Tax=Cichlidogyrus casuarinus TaxID=1844966 RepID=A0ABD2QDV8_9PLAT
MLNSLMQKSLLIARNFTKLFEDELDDVTNGYLTHTSTSSLQMESGDVGICGNPSTITGHDSRAWTYESEGEALELRCSVRNGNIEMTNRMSRDGTVKPKFKLSTCCPPQVIRFEPLAEEGSASLKNRLLGRQQSSFIDVWPVHPLHFIKNRDLNSSELDISGKFMLQLACLVGRAKQDITPYQLRVMVLTRIPNVGAKQFICETQERLANLLASMRINAHIFLVPCEVTADDGVITADHLKSINSLIKSKCSKFTAVCMLHLYKRGDSAEILKCDYLDSLANMSQGLPPTLFVHGQHDVTSTEL